MTAMTTTKKVTRIGANKPATSDKPRRSSRNKDIRKNKRKLESKLKDEFVHRQHSDGSAGTADDDDHEADDFHSPGRQKYRDKYEVNEAKIEEAQQYDAKTLHRGCSQSRSIQELM